MLSTLIFCWWTVSSARSKLISLTHVAVDRQELVKCPNFLHFLHCISWLDNWNQVYDEYCHITYKYLGQLFAEVVWFLLLLTLLYLLVLVLLFKMEVYLLGFVMAAAAVFVVVVNWWDVNLFAYLFDCCAFASCHLGIASSYKAGLPLHRCHYHHW